MPELSAYQFTIQSVEAEKMAKRMRDETIADLKAKGFIITETHDEIMATLPGASCPVKSNT